MKKIPVLPVAELRPPGILNLVFAISGLLLHAVVQAQGIANSETEEPEDYVRWDSAYIQSMADRLETELGDKSMVWETIGNYDGHSLYLVLRGETGFAEIHETESDVQIGVRGTAVSVVGGRLVDAVSLPRKQQRGKSIDGGMRGETAPGDLIHIPPGVAHQLIIDEPYMYLLFKLDEEPLE